ncbi:LysM peptidoglycan-binding domain-containing protein [Arthrobacter sp. B3I9]|uniref:LysM peptidoglycan-binding domain-containing protein n=1 Tax=Arthrobacter sp. B3I9 TaxID=3042270 RepID=UPI0027D8EF7A|nr:LysM peptidoglycan-binding domain-containing protein [Arthrobacter sp. B3I9]
MSKPTRRLGAAVTAGAMSAVVLSTMFGGTASAATPAAVYAPLKVAAPATYTVRSGDTLGGIAARHGVSLASIFAANNMSARTIIYPGQKIKLQAATKPVAKPAPKPIATTPAAKPAPSKPAATPAAATHTVKPGDTLSAIAALHRVSLASIFAANNMSAGTIIYPGQKIRLAAAAAPAPKPVAKPAPKPVAKPAPKPVAKPAPKPVAKPAPKPVAKPAPKPVAKPASTTSYVVKSGDTLSRIAASNGVSLAAVLAANGMNLRTIIYPGQKIILTGKTTAAPAPAPAAPSSSPSVAQLKAMVTATARRMKVDPSLALAFAMQESSFRQNVTSSAGAVGTMQVMPTSGEWASQLVGRPLDLRKAQDNVTAGVAIISALVSTSPSKEIAIASYYQGQYSVMSRGMYEDTKDYVASVLRHQKSFR